MLAGKAAAKGGDQFRKGEFSVFHGGSEIGVAAFVSIDPAADVLPMCGVLRLPFVAILPADVIGEGVHRGFVALADVCRDFVE